MWFKDSLNDGILKMYATVDEALSQMNRVLGGHRADFTVETSFEIEHRINALRDSLKDQNVASLDNKEYSYELGTVLSDLIAECEKTGDYVINVVEARLGLS